VFVTRDFVFLHVPKTGGTYVRTHLPEVLYETQHGGIKDIPSEFQGLPKYAVVRNPWDWYVSWWTYSRKHRKDTIDGAWCQGTLESALTQMIWDHRAYREFGLYDWMFWQIIGSVHLTKVLRFEHFQEEVSDLFETFGYPAPPVEKVGASERGHYRDYYDDFTRELVSGVSSRVIRKFGYQF
jgi:hypothetical protein